MPAVVPLIYEYAHWLGLVPLLWLGVLAYRLEPRDAAWWWLAGVYGVSFVADTLAHAAHPDLVGNLYPLMQAALGGAVLLTRRHALALVSVLAGVALLAVTLEGPVGMDLLLRTVAWGAIVGLVWPIPAPFRLALLVTFGGGLLAWYAAAIAPGPATGLLYHGTRLAGTLLFCRAAWRPNPSLTVVAA